MTRLDFWWVGTLDIRQWTLVELLLQRFREQNRQFSVVDQLDSSAMIYSVISETYRNTKVDCCSSGRIVWVIDRWCSRSRNVDDRGNLILLQYLSELSLVLDWDVNSFDVEMLLRVDMAFNLGS